MGYHLLLTAHSASHITSDVHKGKEADEYRGYANRGSPLWLVKQQDYYRTYQQRSYPCAPSYQHRVTEAHNPQSTPGPIGTPSRMYHPPCSRRLRASRGVAICWAKSVAHLHHIG